MREVRGGDDRAFGVWQSPRGCVDGRCRADSSGRGRMQYSSVMPCGRRRFVRLWLCVWLFLLALMGPFSMAQPPQPIQPMDDETTESSSTLPKAAHDNGIAFEQQTMDRIEDEHGLSHTTEEQPDKNNDNDSPQAAVNEEEEEDNETNHSDMADTIVPDADAPMKDDNDNDDDTSTATTSTQQQQQQQQQQLPPLIVGDGLVYPRPFAAVLPAMVVAVLDRHLPHDWPTPHQEAAWFMELGLAHRSVMERGNGRMEDTSGRPDSFHNDDTSHERRAVAAIRHSIHIYQGLRLDEAEQTHNNPDNDSTHTASSLAEATSLTLQNNLATAYFTLAETYTLVPSESSHNHEAAHAPEFWQQAHDLFVDLMDRADRHNNNNKNKNNMADPDTPSSSSSQPQHPHSVDVQKIRLNWAQCCLRLGVEVLATAEDTAMRESVKAATEAMAQVPNDHAGGGWNGGWDGGGGMWGMDSDDDTWWGGSGATSDPSHDLYSAAAFAATTPVVTPDHILALTHLANALDVFGTALFEAEMDPDRSEEDHGDDSSSSKSSQYQQHLRDTVGVDELRHNVATALHHLGRAAGTCYQWNAAILFQVQALKGYQSMLHLATRAAKRRLGVPLDDSDTDKESRERDGNDDRVQAYVRTHHGELIVSGSVVLYSLSGVTMQLERYEESKQYYQQSMDWNARYQLEPPHPSESGLTMGSSSDGMDGEDDAAAQASRAMIAEYEQALEEYHLASAHNHADGFGDYADNTYDGSSSLVDHGWEADVHATLGSLYLSLADLVGAESHFVQANRLYHLAAGGDEDDSSLEMVGSVQYNLSLLYLHTGEYAESAQAYAAAMDVFAATVRAETAGAQDATKDEDAEDPTVPHVIPGDPMGLDVQDAIVSAHELVTTLQKSLPESESSSPSSSTRIDGAEETLHAQQQLRQQDTLPIVIHDMDEIDLDSNIVDGPGMRIDLQSFLQQNDTEVVYVEL